MRIEVGMRFSVHWVGHESYYQGRLYEVLAISRNCCCAYTKVSPPKPAPAPTHIHICAKRVDIEESEESWFGFINEELYDIYFPERYHLQIESSAKAIQLSMF